MNTAHKGISWNTPLAALPKMTEVRLRGLQAEGFETVLDVLRHYPRRHEDRRKFPLFPTAGTDAPLCLRGTVLETKMSRFGRRCMFTLALAEQQDAAPLTTIRCRWFNLRYLHKILQAGQDLVIHGRPRALKKGGVVFDHPDFEVLETDAPDSNLIHLNRIAPVYSPVSPWSPRMLRRLIFELLAQLADAPGEAPETARAIRAIHFPGSWEELEQARTRLAREELLEMQLVLGRQRQRHKTGHAPVISRRGALAGRLLASLPFKLTAAQKRVLGAIFDDLAAGEPMNRLLHGDVGSGKTVVAAITMVAAVDAGYSAALMAPTQVLAHQHYENLRRMLDPLGIPVDLHTAARRERTVGDSPRIIVGTHALLFSAGSPGSPALVVIDEQHKFGVRQRAKLSDREPRPHVLVMSATPIPRTLALTLYGDLDLSVLDELPPGRIPVRTLVRTHEKLDEAAQFVRGQLDLGRQAYLIYPVIEEGKRSALKAASAEHKRWSELLAPHCCALLHGKLTGDEKDAIMRSFHDGSVRVLVSTTVIEVGVDVANATVLLVENAERFGLAQLHQLRGRVGRGAAKSWCILLAGKDAGDKIQRLQILEQAADGFAIAEADLAQRGPGDMLGTAQTGLPPVRLARLPQDLSLLEQARSEAARILAHDPELTQQPALRSRLDAWQKRLYAGIA